MKTLRSNDDAILLIREQRPFQSKVYRYPDQSGTGRTIAIRTLNGITQAPLSQARREWGALPSDYHSSVDSASYIVLSYETPIAWFATRPFAGDDLDNAEMLKFLATGEYGKWVVPNINYSITTTDHQSLVRAALGAWGRPFWDMDPRPEPIPYVTGPASDTIKVPCGTGRRGW